MSRWFLAFFAVVALLTGTALSRDGSAGALAADTVGLHQFQAGADSAPGHPDDRPLNEAEAPSDSEHEDLALLLPVPALCGGNSPSDARPANPGPAPSLSPCLAGLRRPPRA